MPTKLPKDERQRSSSIDRTTPATKQKNMSGAAADEISAEQMKRYSHTRPSDSEAD